MKYLVTGSEGFIGKALCASLEADQHTVYKIDKKTGHDLCNLSTVEALPEVDIVIHLAAYNGTKWFYKKPFDVVRDNTLPTLNLLERYKSSIDLFVFAGTCESYAGTVESDPSQLPTDENVTLCVNDIMNPRWSYGGSKIGNEVSVTAAHEQHSLNFCILRYHNIYGPGQKDHFFPEFIQRIKAGDASLNGYDNTRSFLFISDAVHYTKSIINNPKAWNNVINIGGDTEISIKDAAELILARMNIRLKLILKPAPSGSVSRRSPCTKKLHSFCGRRDEVSLASGIDIILENL